MSRTALFSSSDAAGSFRLPESVETKKTAASLIRRTESAKETNTTKERNADMNSSAKKNDTQLKTDVIAELKYEPRRFVCLLNSIKSNRRIAIQRSEPATK
jgi:hypothetical protein